MNTLKGNSTKWMELAGVSKNKLYHYSHNSKVKNTILILFILDIFGKIGQ